MSKSSKSSKNTKSSKPKTSKTPKPLSFTFKAKLTLQMDQAYTIANYLMFTGSNLALRSEDANLLWEKAWAKQAGAADLFNYKQLREFMAFVVPSKKEIIDLYYGQLDASSISVRDKSPVNHKAIVKWMSSKPVLKSLEKWLKKLDDSKKAEETKSVPVKTSSTIAISQLPPAPASEPSTKGKAATKTAKKTAAPKTKKG